MIIDCKFESKIDNETYYCSIEDNLLISAINYHKGARISWRISRDAQIEDFSYSPNYFAFPPDLFDFLKIKLVKMIKLRLFI